MFRRGRHRASKGCHDHVSEIRELKEDLDWYQMYHDRFVLDLVRVRSQLERLQTELGSENDTQIITLSESLAIAKPVYEELKRKAPEMITVRGPGGFTMLLPVGRTRGPRARPLPSWALRE